MSDNIKNSGEKPTLEELLHSKRFYKHSLNVSSKFRDEVKIRTLNSIHTEKKWFARMPLLVLPILIFSFILFNYLLPSESTTPTIASVSESAISSPSVNDTSTFSNLSKDLINSEVEYVENSYFVAPSAEYEKSFAIKTLDIEIDSLLFSSTKLDSDGSYHPYSFQDSTF